MSWSHQNATTCMLAKDNGAPQFPLEWSYILVYLILSHSQRRAGDFSTLKHWMHTNFKMLLMTHYTQTEVLRISTEIGKWLLVL